MDRRPLQQATLSMAAVVDTFFVAGTLQIAVCYIELTVKPYQS